MSGRTPESRSGPDRASGRQARDSQSAREARTASLDLFASAGLGASGSPIDVAPERGVRSDEAKHAGAGQGALPESGRAEPKRTPSAGVARGLRGGTVAAPPRHAAPERVWAGVRGGASQAFSLSPEGADNEALARAVAAEWADSGFRVLPVRIEGWSVSAVNAAARELIEGVLPPLWVVGEVANFTRARSGHCYFSLRDDQSQIRCVMWRDEARRLPTTPAEGMQVRALGRLTVYEARGEFQLVVSELEGKGDGLWKLAFDRIRLRLEEEGLLDAARKRPIPRCPACVGVVTSASGAALRDIISVVRRRAPWTRIVLCGCRVQGDGAAAEIAAAVRTFAQAGCADVLIIGRGGGSVEDLWAFNEEVVARAIAESPIPTISAVGHETDVTIADLVCDLRAPTPSAAAEAAVPDGATLRREVRSHRDRLGAAVLARVGEARGSLADLGAAAEGATEERIRAVRQRLGAAAGRLQALSPLGALARGFAVPLGPDGTVLRHAADFVPGDAFDLRLVDGAVPCRVADANPPA